MKKNYYALFMTVLLTAANCQNFKWAKSVPAPADLKGIITGPKNGTAGTVYMYGSVLYEAGFGSYDGLANNNTGSFMLRVDAEGNLMTEKHWKQPLFVQEMISDGDNAIYFTGLFYGSQSVDGHPIVSSGRSDGFVAKMDAEGNVQWITSFGGADNDYGGSLALRADKTGILVSGGTTSELKVNGVNKQVFSGRQTLVLELGNDGTYSRHKLFDFYDTLEGDNGALQIRADKHGNYLMACHQKGEPSVDPYSGVAYLGIYMYKLDANLDTVWTERMCSTDYYGAVSGELSCSPEGDAYFGYYISSKYGGTGRIERLSATDRATTWMLQTSDSWYDKTCYANDNIYFTGREGAKACPCPDATSGYPVIKSFDKNNNQRFSIKIEGGLDVKDVAADGQSPTLYIAGRYRSAPFVLGGLQVEGEISDYYPYEGTFIAAIEDTPTSVREEGRGGPLLAVFPNPSSDVITISVNQQLAGSAGNVRVTDIVGHTLLQSALDPTSQQARVEVDVSKLSSGIYIVELVAGGTKAVRQIAVQ